jgi:hypothetical protein
MKIPVTKLIMADKTLTKALLNQLPHLPSRMYFKRDLSVLGYVNTDGKAIYVVQHEQTFYKSVYLSAFRRSEDGLFRDISVEEGKVKISRHGYMSITIPVIETEEEYADLVEKVNNAKQIFI